MTAVFIINQSMFYSIQLKNIPRGSEILLFLKNNGHATYVELLVLVKPIVREWRLSTPLTTQKI